MDVYVVTNEQHYACNFSVVGVAATLEDAQAMAGGGEWVDHDGDWSNKDFTRSENIYRFQLGPTDAHETTIREAPNGRYVWSCTCGQECLPNGYTERTTAFDRSLNHFTDVSV